MPSKAMTLEATRRSLADLLLPPDAPAVPVRLIGDDSGLDDLSESERGWVEAQGWSPKLGSVLLLPDGSGRIGGALLGTGGSDWSAQAPLLAGALPGALPEGDYRFASPLPDPEPAPAVSSNHAGGRACPCSQQRRVARSVTRHTLV